MDSPAAIMYEESRRAIEVQAASLDELRSRTGLLLAAASLTASFLAAQTTSRGDLGTLGGAALASFALAVGACIYVLWPRKDGWTFVLSAKVLGEDWIDHEREDGVAAMQRFIAEKLEAHYDRNQDKLDALFRWFQIAAVATGAEVILWTLQLST